MLTGIIGKKVGMTQVYQKDGSALPATVIKAGPCVVVQMKTAGTDGYDDLNPYAKIIADEAMRRGIRVEIPDAEWGESLRAFVVVRPGHHGGRLLGHQGGERPGADRERRHLAEDRGAEGREPRGGLRLGGGGSRRQRNQQSYKQEEKVSAWSTSPGLMCRTYRLIDHRRRRFRGGSGKSRSCSIMTACDRNA